MNIYKQLFIFVEGTNDERFISSVFLPKWSGYYDFIKVIQYACKVPSEISKLISVIKNQSSSDYIFICDMDARGDKSLCIANRKEKINIKFSSLLELEKIIIVREEIESWYLAGIHRSSKFDYEIKISSPTDFVTKEEFNKEMPKNFDSLTDYLVEILKIYSLEQAVLNNNSLNYFHNKYVINKK